MIREQWEGGRRVARWHDTARTVTLFDKQERVAVRRGWNNDEKKRYASGLLRTLERHGLL